MRRALLTCLLALATSSVLAQDVAPIALTPTEVGEIFCLSRTGNDDGPIVGLLTPELTEAIAEAERKNTDWEKANPGDKPPLGDGIPWAAWPDYASQCSVGEPIYMMDEATVAIFYGFPEDPGANFSDKLLLKLIPGTSGKVWRIDNVAYATEGDLRSALNLAFMDN